jgi:hypothetical protein
MGLKHVLHASGMPVAKPKRKYVKRSDRWKNKTVTENAEPATQGENAGDWPASLLMRTLSWAEHVEAK